MKVSGDNLDHHAYATLVRKYQLQLLLRLVLLQPQP
jgi:hypothetical protein